MDELDGNRKRDKYDDHPFQDFHAPIGRLIGDFFIDTFQRLEFTQDARIPVVDVKAPVDGAIDPRQVLVAEKFEGVIDALEQRGIIYLQLGNAAQIGA